MTDETTIPTPTYGLEPEAASLPTYMVDVDAETAAAAPEMRDTVRGWANNHNDVLALLSGTGDYEGSYLAAAEPQYDAAGRPLAAPAHDQSTVYTRDLITEGKTTAWATAWNAELVRHRLGLLARDCPDHPVVQHAQALLERCRVAGEIADVWPECVPGPGV